MKKVVIYGAGPYGKLFFAEAERYGAIDIVAFTVDEQYILENNLYGLPVVPFGQIEKVYPPDQYDMLVVCGYSRMRNRMEMYNKAKAKGYALVNYISPGAFLENEIKMGDNNIIFSNSVIGFDGVMGNGNIIRQNVYLGHEFELKDHIIISVGCTIGGYSKIGSLSFFGFSVTSSGFRTFGEECLIGAGSIVVKDIEPYSKNYGNPARLAGYHKDTGVVIREGRKNG